MIKVYSFERSGHAHRVRLFLSLLGIEHETIDVPILSGGGRSDAHLARNPFGLVPVLDDDGVLVRDSNAILVYLARKHDPDDRWLPVDAECAARVQEWLATATHDLLVGPAYARAATLFGRPFDVVRARKRAHRLLKIMDAHLAGRDWLASDHPTVADVAMYTYTAHAPEGGVALDEYASVQGWLRRIEALEGFIPMVSTSPTAAPSPT